MSRSEHDPRPRRWRLGALTGAALLAGLTAHNTRQVVRARDRARAGHRPLEHAGTVGHGAGEALRLVVLGDSSAAGFGLRDASVALPHQVATRLSTVTGRPVHVASLARDGARTRDVAVRQAPHLRHLDADVVVVVAGVNDAIGRTPLRDLAGDTAHLADELARHAAGAAVAYVGCPNLRDAPSLPRPLHALVGLACRRVVQVQRRVLADRPLTFVDVYGPLTARDFGPDGFHPGAHGSARIATRVVDALTSHEEEPAWT